MLTNVLRTWYIITNSDTSSSSGAKYKIPLHDRRTIVSLFSTGALTFASGFLVWNLDNLFCNTVTGWKYTVGWPGAFLLEGSWLSSCSRDEPYFELFYRSFLVAHPYGKFSC